MKSSLLTIGTALLLQLPAAHALPQGITKWQTSGGKLVLVHGIYQDVLHYRRNYSFYFQPGSSNDWLQVPIMDKKGVPNIGWDSASRGEVTLADGTVVQRADGMYFITASKQSKGSEYDPGDVTVVWHHLLDAGDNDHDGTAQQFFPASTRIIRAVPNGVDDILEKEANLPFVQKHPAEILVAKKISVSGKAVSVLRLVGKTDEKFLVLAEKPVKSANGRQEHVELSANFYAESGAQWKSEWAVNDFIDCPGNDGKASFFPDATAITDIDNDGKPEVTVAYQLSCAGSTEPATVKVILRQGETKFAVRGGTPDPVLQQSKNAAYLKHLETVWKAVDVKKR